jgi:hypothetical protein
LLLGAMPTKIGDEVRAKRFVLVDKDGRDRARLISGHPWRDDVQFPAVLQFLDKEGRIVGHFGVLAGRDGTDTGHLRLSDKAEKTSILILPTGLNAFGLHAFGDDGLVSLGASGLSVSGGVEGKPGRSSSSYQASGVSISGPNGTSSASLRVLVPKDTPDFAMLRLSGKGAVGGASLTSDSDGSSSLSLRPTTIESGISLRVESGEAPSLRLADDTGQTRAVLGGSELIIERTGLVQKLPTSSLVLFGKDGKVIWKAP